MESMDHLWRAHGHSPGKSLPGRFSNKNINGDRAPPGNATHDARSMGSESRGTTTTAPVGVVPMTICCPVLGDVWASMNKDVAVESAPNTGNQGMGSGVHTTLGPTRPKPRDTPHVDASNTNKPAVPGT